jgi:hypothetical protein
MDLGSGLEVAEDPAVSLPTIGTTVQSNPGPRVRTAPTSEPGAYGFWNVQHKDFPEWSL